MTGNEMKTWRQEIIEKITEARVAKGMTQTQLAELLGTHRSNISRLESGSHSPSLDFLLRVAAALELKIEIIPPSKNESTDLQNTYELRLYDLTLLTFTLEEKGIEGLTVHVFNINEEQKHLLPLGLEHTDDGVLKWLKKRVIPKNRTFVEEILKTLKLSQSDTKGIIDVCKGLSLNDSFWVVPKGFKGSFKQYNLYENRFSEILSLVAYTGVGQRHDGFTTSPELTTAGMLPKAWRFFDSDGIYLYKGGSFGAANTGNEPYSEYYACQIAQTMGLNSVQYDLENWKGILASKCKLFCDIDTAFIPIGQIVVSGGLKAVLDYYSGIGEDFLEALRSMLVFDAVIYNEDRHFGNFGVLRDNHSGALISPAPLFDHGLALFNYAMPEDIKNIDEYAKTRLPAYPGVKFEDICAEVMGKKQAQQLRRLIGFTFKRHPSINWTEERLIATERHLQKRVRQLLGLAR
ncbi:MAG TPA: helix-turn-helix domain-containing protein [Clostridia bacterium]|nr:helix-turn-helix domain-containing protein [Clostridia bacterium]HQO70549.1 helix-turn-helix domain-containing protein [Clostridia bacterium]